MHPILSSQFDEDTKQDQHAFRTQVNHTKSIPPLNLQERLSSHGISSTGFPGTGHRTAADFQHPYFPPPFPTSAAAQAQAQAQQAAAAQEVFAAQQTAQHLAATDPYNVNSLHSHFQTSQVSIDLVIHVKNLIHGILHA